MSNIVLSASVRQNLLSLQSTADLLASTQSRLATGKKVNSALDNPTNYFTAASLDARASDINNLLDGIGNGVQILQAANTGITSLQKLIDSAKSVATQALQSAVGYSPKSSVTSTAIAGATANNLLGGPSAPTAGTVTAGAFTGPIDVSGTAAAATAAATFAGTGFTNLDVTAGSATFTLNVDGTSQAITIDAAAVTAYNTAGGALVATALTAANVASLINYQFSGGTFPAPATPVTVNGGGQLSIASATTGATSQVTITGFNETGLTAGTTGLANVNNTGAAAILADSLSFTVTIDGGSANTVTLDAASITAYNTANPGSPVNAASLSAADVAAVINYQLPTATTYATVSGGNLVFTSGTTGASSSIATSAVTSVGTPTGSTGVAVATNTGTPGTTTLGGLTLMIPATAHGTATSITFGTGLGQVSSLNQLNAALAPNMLLASIDPQGRISITTTSDSASETIGAFGGTAALAGTPFFGGTGSAPVVDPTVQTSRANLVSQYNKIIEQIVTTSQDSSFNGVNLLAGDTLKLVFNETGKSTLNITGVNFSPAGLGLGALTSGTDFIDNNNTNIVMTALNDAGTTLRSQAAALGSNLSIVQIRQEFSKNLINVLQTGSSNLTLADTNEEAANSQALSTRQSIAVSALALANQSQQSVLQLLRT